MDYPVIYGRDPSLVRYGSGMDGGKEPYFEYVRQYRAEHPQLTWMQAVKKAAKSYKCMEDGGSWPGDYSGHRKAALKGWKTREKEAKKKKKKKKGGTLAGDFAHSEAALKGWQKRYKEMGMPKKALKELHKERAILKKAMAAGILAAGEQSYASRRLAAIKGWVTRYKNEGKYAKARKEKKKLPKASKVY